MTSRLKMMDGYVQARADPGIMKGGGGLERGSGGPAPGKKIPGFDTFFTPLNDKLHF